MTITPTKTKLVSQFLSIIVIVMIMVAATPVSAKNIWDGTGPKGGPTCNIGETGCNLCAALKVTQNIINFLTTIAIGLAALMVVFGAIRLMTAGGSEEKVSSGKKAITSALVGLLIALAAYAIINTILNLMSPSGFDFKTWSNLEC